MAKPTLKPRWASTVTADPARYFEPPAGKKDIGWDTGERPPAQYENWLRGTTSQWIDWLDTFESTPHTWTAGQTFAPATAEPAITVEYNPAVAAGFALHPLIAFQPIAGGLSTIVDRLGAPTLQWKRRNYDWQGRVLVGTVAADTDYEIQNEISLWLRNSGIGPVALTNVFSAKVNDPSVGSVMGSVRELVISSQFESVVNQYNLLYGDPICAKPATTPFALVLDSRIIFDQPTGGTVSNYQAFGLFRKETLGAGLTGRDPLVQDHLLLVHSRTLNTVRVSYRDGGVSDPLFDTDLPPNQFEADPIRIEIISDPNRGGPYTAIWLDGIKIYSVNKVHSGQTAYAIGAIAKPLVIESGVSTSMRIAPIGITWIASDIT